jgi:hypothetical protein
MQGTQASVRKEATDSKLLQTRSQTPVNKDNWFICILCVSDFDLRLTKTHL